MLPLQSTDKKIQFLKETIVSELQRMNACLVISSSSHSHQSTRSQPHLSTSSQQATLTSTVTQPQALSPEEHTSHTSTPSQAGSVELVSCSLEGEEERGVGGEGEERGREAGREEEDGGGGRYGQASGEGKEGEGGGVERGGSEGMTEGREGGEGEGCEGDRQEESMDEIEVPRVMDEEAVLDMCTTLGNATPLKLSPGEYITRSHCKLKYTTYHLQKCIVDMPDTCWMT